MNRAIRITGLILASLTVTTVAMAQSSGGNGGGGNGGAGGGSTGGGGDNSIIALRLQDHERARLTRAVQPRRGGRDCLTHACNEPPPPTRRPPAREFTVLNESCGGGEYLVIRNRYGQVVRYVCETR
jgi:hypothetical protein